MEPEPEPVIESPAECDPSQMDIDAYLEAIALQEITPSFDLAGIDDVIQQVSHNPPPLTCFPNTGP